MTSFACYLDILVYMFFLNDMLWKKANSFFILFSIVCNENVFFFFYAGLLASIVRNRVIWSLFEEPPVSINNSSATRRYGALSLSGNMFLVKRLPLRYEIIWHFFPSNFDSQTSVYWTSIDFERLPLKYNFMAKDWLTLNVYCLSINVRVGNK